MNKYSIASVIVLLIIAILPGVSAATDITMPPSELRTAGANDGIYQYDIAVTGDPLPAEGVTYSFTLGNGNAVAGVLDQQQLREGKIHWTPPAAYANTNNEYIIGIRDVNNAPFNPPISNRFTIRIEGPRFDVTNANDEVLLGGSGSEGERANPGADDPVNEKKITRELVVRNTGDLPGTVDSIAVTYAPEAGITDNKDAYALKLVTQNQRVERIDNNVVVNPDTDHRVTVEANLVKDLHAVDATLVVKQWVLGSITVTPAAGIAAVPAVPIKIQAENMLELKKVEVCATGVTERCKRYDKGDTVENLKPNDKLSITVILENNFDDKTNLDMDGKVEIDTDDTDVIDLDENDEEDTVETNTETEFELSAAIEDDADGTGTLEVKVSGIDDNGARHGEKWDLKFKVEREAHEIAITSMRLTPPLLSCSQSSRDVQLEVDVRNIGKKKEREVKIEIEANRGDFKLQKSESDIEVDKNDELPVKFTFNVPVTVEPGTYPIEVKTYTKRTSLSSTETTTLTVPDCGFVTAPEPEPEEEQKKEDEVVVTTPSAGIAPAAPAGAAATATPVAKKATKTFTASNAYIGALVAIIVVLLVIGGILVAMIVRKQ